MGFAGLLIVIGFAVLVFFGYDWYCRAKVNDPAAARKWAFITIAVALFIVTLRVGVPALFSFLTACLFLAPAFFNAGPKAADPVPGARMMSLREAASILGLPQDANEDQISFAWRERMRRHHPDQGGSDVLASLINRARDVMLEHSRRR